MLPTKAQNQEESYQRQMPFRMPSLNVRHLATPAFTAKQAESQISLEKNSHKEAQSFGNIWH